MHLPFSFLSLFPMLTIFSIQEYRVDLVLTLHYRHKLPRIQKQINPRLCLMVFMSNLFVNLDDQAKTSLQVFQIYQRNSQNKVHMVSFFHFLLLIFIFLNLFLLHLLLFPLYPILLFNYLLFIFNLICLLIKYLIFYPVIQWIEVILISIFTGLFFEGFHWIICSSISCCLIIAD